MNYKRTMNLHQTAQQQGNCIINLQNEILKDGIDKDDINWILSRIDEIRQYQIQIEKTLKLQVEVDNY